MTAAALSEVSNGAKWNPDPSFSVAEAILDDPAFASVLRAVLSDGHVVVPAQRPRGNDELEPDAARSQWLWFGRRC